MSCRCALNACGVRKAPPIHSDFFSKTDKIHSTKESTSSSYHQRNEIGHVLTNNMKSDVRFSNSRSQKHLPWSNSSFSNTYHQREGKGQVLKGQVLTTDKISDVRISNSRSKSPPPSSNSSYSNSSHQHKEKGQVISTVMKSDVRFSNSHSQKHPLSSNSSYSNFWRVREAERFSLRLWHQKTLVVS